MNFTRTFLLLVIVAVAAGFACYRLTCDPLVHAAARDGDALRWIRQEFRLNDEQFAAILRLHEVHSEACARHCADVREARARLEEARQAGRPDAVAPAAAEVARVEAVCRGSVEAHVRRVAAAMDPEQGRRYLAIVLPRLGSLDHAGPPDLGLNPRS